MGKAAAVDPKWRAVGARIVACDVCGKDDQVIYLRRGDPGAAIYRCREHTDITDLTDPHQVEW